MNRLMFDTYDLDAKNETTQKNINGIIDSNEAEKRTEGKLGVGEKGKEGANATRMGGEAISPG